MCAACWTPNNARIKKYKCNNTRMGKSAHPAAGMYIRDYEVRMQVIVVKFVISLIRSNCWTMDAVKKKLAILKEEKEAAVAHAEDVDRQKKDLQDQLDKVRLTFELNDLASYLRRFKWQLPEMKTAFIIITPRRKS